MLINYNYVSYYSKVVQTLSNAKFPYKDFPIQSKSDYFVQIFSWIIRQINPIIRKTMCPNIPRILGQNNPISTVSRF